MRTLSGVLSIAGLAWVATACAGNSEVALPAAPLMAFSDSLRIVEPSTLETFAQDTESLDDEEARLEGRLRDLEQLVSEHEALANLKREQQDLAAAQQELAAIRSDTAAVGGEQVRERLVQGQTRMAERAREVADAEIDYIEHRLEAIEAQRRVIRLTDQLEGSVGSGPSADSAQAVERRAAARHRAERELVNAWVDYADRQQEAADSLRDWAHARRALIEERSALIGTGG